MEHPSLIQTKQPKMSEEKKRNPAGCVCVRA